MRRTQERALFIHWHKEKKASIRSISKRLWVSHNTVRHWLRAGAAPEEHRACSQYGRSIHENAADIWALFVNCQLRRCINKRYQVDIPLRMLQRYCAPLRRELRLQTFLKDTLRRFETAPDQHYAGGFWRKRCSAWRSAGASVYFHLQLGSSRRIFAKSYLRKTQKAWLDGME